MPYLLDSTALIDAERRWYGLDFCPAYWDWLTAAMALASCSTSSGLRMKFEAGDDGLVEWIVGLAVASLAARHGCSFAAERGRYVGVIRCLQVIGCLHFSRHRCSLLVARAHGHGFTVVIQEVPRDQIANIKIPLVVAMGVSTSTPSRCFAMTVLALCCRRNPDVYDNIT